MRKTTAARSEFAAESLVGAYLKGRAMPGILRRVVVCAAERRLAAGERPVLDATLRRDIDNQAGEWANAPDGVRSVEWTTRIEADGAIEGGPSYHADVYRNGECVCRIALDGYVRGRRGPRNLEGALGRVDR